MRPEADPNTRLHVSSSVYVRPFGEEIVILDFGRGEYFALDEVGANVWRGIEKGECLGAIARSIAGEYEVSEADALKDIIALVVELTEQALVEPQTEAAAARAPS